MVLAPNDSPQMVQDPPVDGQKCAILAPKWSQIGILTAVRRYLIQDSPCRWPKISHTSSKLVPKLYLNGCSWVLGTMSLCCVAICLKRLNHTQHRACHEAPNQVLTQQPCQCLAPWQDSYPPPQCCSVLSVVASSWCQPCVRLLVRSLPALEGAYQVLESKCEDFFERQGSQNLVKNYGW